MRRMKTHGISRRLTAMVLCLCMIVSMVSGFGAATAAASTSDDGYTQYIVEGSRKADPNTMDDYVNRLLSMTNGSRYAGRVWTDKTVFAYSADPTKVAEGGVANNEIALDMFTDGYDGKVGFDADFAHVFSALASSQVVNEYPPSPVDLVIVFDMSGSMGQDTRFGIDTGVNTYVAASDEAYPDEGVLMSERIANSRVQKTLDAINHTIDALMAQNPQNRVAVCGYGANAVVLMPLGHYQHADTDGDGNPDEDEPYLTVGGMETLYHPSDLVYREPEDSLSSSLGPVTESGWYWMNNRDTCYTVVVNAQYNTYTGVLDDDGDNDAAHDAWRDVKKTVSNNALDSDGNRVKAFPGAWNDDGKPKDTYKTQSQTVYQKAKADPYNFHGPYATELIEAIENTEALHADDYVGYFTNTQGGIYLAYKQLADSAATTYTEELSNGVISTVARIPAAIIMSDGGANFAFNEMGQNAETQYQARDWNARYGQRMVKGNPKDPIGPEEVVPDSDPRRADHWYMNDNNWASKELTVDWDDSYVDGHNLDMLHRVGGTGAETTSNLGDEWYHVYLPGKDNLGEEWNGLNGIYNTGADYFKDGTLSTMPTWNRAGVLYNSDNYALGTSGTVLEVLLTAAYMNDVVKKHYSNGWQVNNATLDSRVELSTYTMNVDTSHVPQWGRLRLYPTLDPKDFPLDDIESARWYEQSDKFGTNEDLWAALHIPEGVYRGYITLEGIFDKTTITNGLFVGWTNWKAGAVATLAIGSDNNGQPPITINSIGDGESISYFSGAEKIDITRDDIVNNIAYNDEFYDVTSEGLGDTFGDILGLILGKVFVPISGDNDAGVDDSITYQDPLGEYMEIKNGSIITTPYHTNSVPGSSGLPTDPQTYDMAMLLFGEMHGLIRAGVYDWHWNDDWMSVHNEEGKGSKAFPQGWYKGEASTAESGGDGDVPVKDGKQLFETATQARAAGWIFRLNYTTAVQYVPILDSSLNPDSVSDQMKNTVYTVYRFNCSDDDRNTLRRNPIYGEIPKDVMEKWEKATAGGDYPNNTYDVPTIDPDLYPGLYRLNDIRVWTEETGDFVDQDGAITPNGGYDLSLYLNVPAAAIPTELATITMGKDGVLSYKTNLGSDHEVGTSDTDVNDEGEEITVTVDADRYHNYCYQSTPLRLFYAVGLEEDLILRDSLNKQVGVDFNAISAEYISSHTVEKKDYIWFISNYYSNTPYSEYDTDSTGTRTRGDPTVSFNPGRDNRYYVFQKPLPLYAHAYRVTGRTLTAVDNVEGQEWGSGRSGNGKTIWEGSTSTAGGGGWAGGVYMGTYNSADAFSTAYEASDKNTITDDTGINYPFVEGGIIFLKEDLLEQVTSDATGNYTEGSTSFSSEDYFFLLVEYYLPTEGTVGKDDMNEEVAGTTDGRMVQYALARKGSEFGSAFFSEDINNGDMLCWTDTSNNLNLEFDYLSFTDTGDYTRGEPTFEKLTYNEEGKLKEYLKTKCGIPEGKTIVEKNAEGEEATVNVLDQQVKYWLDKQNDPLVKAALEAAVVKAGVEVKELSKISFDEYFKFAVAARPGGIRSGDMSNNRLAKKDNTTETSYSYYLPTISDHSGTDDHVIINNYLGNNGYLAIANQKIHVTKMMSAPEGYTLTEYQENEKFDFQVYVQGVTGNRTAVQTQYNEYSKTWERRLAYIDVLTDNSELLLTSGETRALFDLKKEGTTTTARQVVSGDDGQLYYADDQGNPTTEPCPKNAESLYYLYLPSNGEGEAERTRRLYQDPEYNGTADGYGDTDKNEYFKNNGTTTFFEEGQREVTGSEEGPENRDCYRKADDTRTAGTRTYWALDAELIPVSEVNEAEGTSGIMLESVKSWEHQADRETYQKLTYYTIVVRKPNGVTSDAGLITPFKTRSQYMTKELEFGKNANENDGGTKTAGEILTPDDLYDKTIPSVDYPDLFSSVSSEDIAKNTAEFTLKHGEGLLLTGLGDSITYRFTEKLTEEQVKKGYTIKEISQQDSEGTSDTTTIEDPTEVYSVFGSTGGFEAQAHFGNSFNPGTISITKKLDAEEGTEKTEKDKNTEFWFSLKLDTKDGVGISPGEYGYTITDPEDDTSVTGTLEKYRTEGSSVASR